jgi:DNA-binding CsgD family transcriptional regulator/class 3 adenylate cyclase
VTQIVTLLVADLVDTRAPFDVLTEDGADQAKRRCLSLLRKVVAGSGGEEVKNPDDGLMVIFPSAVAAVRCAIAMQQAIQGEDGQAGRAGRGRQVGDNGRGSGDGRHIRADGGAGGTGLDADNDLGGERAGSDRHGRGMFSVRVGLHVGEPIQDDNEYFGTPVVVAKRLCDAAAAGQILASGLVRGLVASRTGFAFRAIGDVTLSGMSRPIDGFEVIWATPSWGDNPARADDARKLPLVGRRDDLHLLEDELSRVGTGQLRAVLIVGDPGVGKTRLATELARRHRADVLTLSSRAYPLGATASLGLWAEGLERHLRGLERSEVIRLCAGDLDDLATLLPSARAARAARAADGGGESAEPPGIRLLGALARLLGRLSEQSPLIIVLDDVHLADGSSWEALSYLTRNLIDCRVLLLLAARAVELAAEPVANDVLLGLEQEGLLRRLTVTTLPADDIAQLAESVIGGPVPGALVTWLMERAQGSPLFAVGLLRALVDESADLEHPTLRALPEDLAERVESRLRLLDAVARAALELMTVVGYRVELSDLVRLSGQSLDELAPILERLVRTRLVSEIEDGRDLSYEIDHPLIQEAIYRSIGGARRRALHRHAARILLEGGRLGAAAPHFVRAAEPGDDEAIGALCGALRQAEDRQYHREALALLAALLELVPAGDRRWEQVLRAMPLQPEWVVDHRADASAEVGVRAMRAIEQVLERSSDSSLRAAVKFNLGSLQAWAMGQIDDGRRLVSEARALFEAGGDRHHALLCDNELAYLAALAGKTADHEARARAVLAEGIEAGDQLVELQALCSLAWALLVAGQLEPAGPVVERALTVARGSDNTYRTTYLLAQQGWVAGKLGRMGEARSLLAEAAAGNPQFRNTYLLDFSAIVDWLAGDLQGVVRSYREQLAWTGGLSRRRVVGGAHAVIALAELGRHSEAADVQTSIDASFGGRHWWMLSDLPRWSGGASTGLRDGRGQGLADLSVAVDHMIELGSWNWVRFALVDLAEAAVDAGDAEAGAHAARLAAADPWLSDAESQWGLRQLVDGAAALARRDADVAVKTLEPAAAAFASVGWTLFEGRAMNLLGLALAAGDRSRAITSLQVAVDRFDSCGAVVRRDRALAVLSGLGTRGRRTRTAITGPDALTRREREVARLASEGRSAKEIAEQLFIGERTVETHLANAYAKLGVGSKLELVRFADQFDL